MHDLIPVLLFAASSAFTPGPNNILIMNSGLNHGIKRSMPHFWGIFFGFPLMILIIAVGLGAVLARYEWLRQILKVLGATYMFYLAWKIYISKLSDEATSKVRPFSFMQAALFQWVNAKAWIMAIGVVSLFTLSENYFINAFLISGLFMLMSIPSVGTWLVVGAFLKKVLKSEKHFKWFNTVMAIALIASIGMILVE